MKYKIAVGKQKFEVEIGVIKDGSAQVTVNDKTYEVNIENFAEVSGRGAAKESPARPVSSGAKAPTPPDTSPAQETAPVSPPSTGGGIVTAPISGRILEIKVNEGDTISVGQELLVLEAMKMENSVNSEVSGNLREIRVRVADQVSAGDVLMVIQ